jgi:hypothetical protein
MGDLEDLQDALIKIGSDESGYIIPAKNIPLMRIAIKLFMLLKKSQEKLDAIDTKYTELSDKFKTLEEK